MFCFDKTGTLTQQGLDFLGVLPFADGSLSPESKMKSPEVEGEIGDRTEHKQSLDLSSSMDRVEPMANRLVTLLDSLGTATRPNLL